VIKVAVPGAAGKMGRMVIEAIAERPSELRLVAAVERAGSAAIGQRVGSEVVVGEDLAAAIGAADVYIDFTAPAATARAVELAAERGVCAVIGTTGVDANVRATIERAAARVPVVFAPNFSIGVNLMLALVEDAARRLSGWDFEIVELHHKAKRDAPSGTAIAIAEAGARGRGVGLDAVKRYAREGDVGARPAGEIGVVAVRGGDVVGEHTAYFFGGAERIELTHRATSRAIFARGAVQAAVWACASGRKAGLYGMRDVLGGV
jgi:4-hydroxy-tetrahydrodipicolinate reductase